MKLFSKAIDNKLFKQYSFGSDLSKQKVVAKIFNPYGNGTWYILNSDPNDTDYLWAIVDLGYGAEVGSVSRSDLETYRNRMRLGFERDMYFDEINAKELYDGLLNGKFYKKGGALLSPKERYILELKGLTGLTQEGVEKYISDNGLTEGEILNIVIGLGRKQIQKTNVSTAMIGNKNNSESKKLIAFAKSDKALKLADGGTIDAFQIRTIKGADAMPTEIRTNEQEVKFAKGGAIKDADIKVGDEFLLINGDVVEIVRLFKENIDENWVEYKRNGEKKENRVKELRLFINRLSGKKQETKAEIIDLGNDFEIRVEKVYDTNGKSTYGASLYYKKELFRYFVYMPDTSKKEAIDNVYKYIKTLKVSDKIVENVPRKGSYAVYYHDRGGEHRRIEDSRKEVEKFIKDVNSLTSEKKHKETLSDKTNGYIPIDSIEKVVTKDGKVFKNTYDDTAVISGVHFSNRPLREKERKDKNQLELFKKGGLPKTAIYIPRYKVDYIETEDNGTIQGNHIYGGIWIDLKKQFRLVEQAKEQGRFGNKPKFKVDDLVYNKRTKSVGIVRIVDEKGETKTDADGNVNTSELEAYNPLKNKSHKNAKVAPSTQKEIDNKGLFKPFSKFEGGGKTQRKVYIVNEGEAFDEKKYKAIYGDYDKDGTSNIDDANPLDKNKKGNVEQVELKETFTKLLNVKADLDSVMYSAIDKLDDKAPKDADIYARTKTPYSILKKLVEKRMLDPQKGLTDMIGTTIAVENQKELEQVRDDIDGGLLGKILDRDDYYENPKAGYRAYHYIVEYKGYPIEVQLKTKKMKEFNEVSHEFYKNGTLDAKGLESVSKTFEMADRGDKKAIKEVNSLLKNKNLLASKISTSKSKKEYAGGGSTTKRGGAMVLAKQIRKDGESWQSALKRANQELKK